MKRFLFLPVIFTFFCLNSIAQDIKTVFPDLPEGIIFGLTKEEKEKLVAHPQDSTVVLDDNDLYENIVRTGISDDYIAIRTSEVGLLQIKLLPLVNDTKVICVIKTVCKGICDSQISFYTTKWVPIEKENLLPAFSNDWFIRMDADRNSEAFRNAIAAWDINPIRFTLSPTDYTLKAELDIKSYLGEKGYEDLKPFLVDSKTFTWNKISFR